MNIDDDVQDTLETLETKISEKISEMLKEIGKLELGEKIQTAWNYEKEDVDVLTFEMIVKWAKENINPQKHSAACLFKSKSAEEYHLFFLDKNGKPLLGMTEKYKLFHTNMIDKTLKEQLQGKDLLILK